MTKYKQREILHTYIFVSLRLTIVDIHHVLERDLYIVVLKK